MASIDDLRDAEELRRWELGRELGRGGTGRVHLAVDRATGEQRAIKIIHPFGQPGEATDRLVRREIDNCLALVHPCIVRGFAGGRAGPAYFLVMEYCAGGGLDQVVEARGPLGVPDATALFFDVLSGLAHAHEVPVRTRGERGPLTVTGLVHRDVKPSNIFVTEGGSPAAKVGDFGLAKAFQAAGLSGLTRSGSSAGTPGFMPRQQVLDFKYASPEVDVWAAAASLYFALTGHTPRDFPPGRDPWRVVWTTSAVPVGERGVPVPVPIARVLDEALDDTAELRYRTIAELRSAVVEACATEGVPEEMAREVPG